MARISAIVLWAVLGLQALGLAADPVLPPVTIVGGSSTYTGQFYAYTSNFVQGQGGTFSLINLSTSLSCAYETYMQLWRQQGTTQYFVPTRGWSYWGGSQLFGSGSEGAPPGTAIVLNVTFREVGDGLYGEVPVYWGRTYVPIEAGHVFGGEGTAVPTGTQFGTVLSSEGTVSYPGGVMQAVPKSAGLLIIKVSKSLASCTVQIDAPTHAVPPHTLYLAPPGVSGNLAAYCLVSPPSNGSYDYDDVFLGWNGAMAPGVTITGYTGVAGVAPTTAPSTQPTSQPSSESDLVKKFTEGVAGKASEFLGKTPPRSFDARKQIADLFTKAQNGEFGEPDDVLYRAFLSTELGTFVFSATEGSAASTKFATMTWDYKPSVEYACKQLVTWLQAGGHIKSLLRTVALFFCWLDFIQRIWAVFSYGLNIERAASKVDW